VRGELKHHLDPAVPLAGHRELDALGVEPLERLPDAPRLAERPEDERHRLLHAHIRILDHLPRAVRHIARGQDADQLPPPGLRLHALQQAQLQDLELHHTERPLDPQHELIIDQAHVVDLLRIADERVEQLADLQQVTPVLVRAGEP
jgi:hypothetical protein